MPERVGLNQGNMSAAVGSASRTAPVRPLGLDPIDDVPYLSGRETASGSRWGRPPHLCGASSCVRQEERRRAIVSALPAPTCGPDVREQGLGYVRGEGQRSTASLPFRLGIGQHQPPLLTALMPLAGQVAEIERAELNRSKPS